MILIDKEITQWFVRPTMQYVSKNMFQKKAYLTDLFDIGNLTISRLDKSDNEKIYILWDKNEKRDVIDFEYSGGKNELRILKIKRHFKELTKQEKVKYKELKDIEKEKKSVLKHPSFIKGYLVIGKKKRGWKAWQVFISYIHEEYRGIGLGKKLYDTVINHDKLMLMTDHKQTEDSKLLWTSFIKSKKYNIWAVDLNNVSDNSVVYWDNDTENVESSLHIWHPDAKLPKVYDRQDVRLVAISNKKK